MMLVLALSAGIERLTEAALAAAASVLPRGRESRRGVAILVSAGLAAVVVAALRVDLASAFLAADLGGAGYVLTALMLAGLAGPLHELQALIESVRRRA